MMAKSLKIAMIGYGSIATYVANAIKGDPLIDIVAVICRPGSVDRASGFADGDAQIVTEIGQVNPKPDLVVDCAGHAGLAEHGLAALAAGIDVITISTGALANAEIAVKLGDAANTGNARVKLLPGAIGGTDVLKSAMAGEVASVLYVGRKPPAGWKGSPAEELCDLDQLAEPFTHFAGTAREAAQKYPKNANVAATIALAGIGLDKTRVELIADPNAAGNMHEVLATGEFGEMRVQIVGKPLATNPRSSALAAMSVVAELRSRTKAITV